MKKGSIFVIALLILFSCTTEKEGDWDDNIKLSQKEFQFDASQSIAIIETEGDSWWISEVFFKEDKQFDISDIDTTAENFILTESDFILERKNGREIVLTLFENNTNAERILVVGLQEGNYFDGIVIKQSAE